AIARMKLEAVNQPITDFEKGFNLGGVWIIAKLEDSRRLVRLSALLNDEEPFCSWLGREEDGSFPGEIGKDLLHGVWQRRLGRANQTGSRPRDAVVEAEGRFLRGGKQQPAGQQQENDENSDHHWSLRPGHH